MSDQRLHYRICLYVSMNQFQGIYGGICNFGTHRFKLYAGTVNAFDVCLCFVLRSYCNSLRNSNNSTTLMDNVQIDRDECCFCVNCSTLCVFPYSSLREAKNYSATNPGMLLPLSRKHLACRQAQPKVSFGTKGALTWVQLPVTIRGNSF